VAHKDGGAVSGRLYAARTVVVGAIHRSMFPLSSGQPAFGTIHPRMPEAEIFSQERRARSEASPGPITIRHLSTWAEYQAGVALQQEVWGVDFFDVVPAAILKVSQRLGGVTAGAFDPDGRLVGFVFGMTGIERGQLVHWSDMLGVRAEARDQGIGRRLKAFQRDALRAIGVSVVYWTYDPLVARNAYLNLTQLGADVSEYVVDMYGSRTSSALHEGMGTDRFIVAWRIDDQPRAPRPVLMPLDSSAVPIITGAPQSGAGASQIRVAIPLHIDQVQRTSLAEAARWRAETRPAFQWALSHGYRVVGFLRDDGHKRGLYELHRL
jgi:predicted GNAT superfamily acetyltransferase